MIARYIGDHAPGLALCLAVTVGALGLQRLEEALFGRAWIEGLVLAILLGASVRTLWTPGPRWRSGILFGAKSVLEVAVVLLGASISAQAVMAVGPGMVIGIAGIVALAIGAGYALGRTLGLSHRLAILVACGNAICGNSAIAAVAPVIGAKPEDVACSVAFTAVLGVLVVLILPFLAPLFGLDMARYGALAGLTVYAVPQVLAATAPIGALASQVGTVVKLVRVLMLGPVVLILSLTARAAGSRPPLHRLVPWFIIGFLGLAGLRSLDVIPHGLLAPTKELTGFLTIVAMAALGLGVDARVVARAGGRVIAVVTLSLLALGGMSLLLIKLL